MLDLFISGTRTSLWKEISKVRRNLGKPALDVGDFGSMTVIGGRDIERKDEGDSGESGLFLFPKGRRKEKRRRKRRAKRWKPGGGEGLAAWSEASVALQN